MTVAICIRCGTIKIGAFSTCEQCGYTPDYENDPEEQKLCLLLTDHFHSVEKLEEIGKAIAEGAKIVTNDPAPACAPPLAQVFGDD